MTGHKTKYTTINSRVNTTLNHNRYFNDYLVRSYLLFIYSCLIIRKKLFMIRSLIYTNINTNIYYINISVRNFTFSCPEFSVQLSGKSVYRVRKIPSTVSGNDFQNSWFGERND